MTLSNALPVQFWTDPDESFNNKVICGRESVCWCQPWNCDDVINLQISAVGDQTYSLNVLDSEDAVLETIAFDQEITDPTDYLSGYPLSGFTNEAGAGSDWTTGATPSVSVTGFLSISDSLVETITGIPAGTYIFRMAYNYTNSGAVTVSFAKLGVSLDSATFLVDANGGYRSTTIVLTDAPDEILFSFRSTEVIGSASASISDIELLSAETMNSISFTPSTYCDQQIKLQIVNNSDETDSATSDCLSIKTSHSCTELITYSNSRDFAGLLYDDVSPAQEFTIRVPAIFYDIENPAEQEDIELSNGEIVRLWNKLERKRLLDFSFLPPFMHEKLQLILMHDTIEIDGREWIRRDAYTKTEGNKRYPLKRASVWLHDKNFITENQL